MEFTNPINLRRRRSFFSLINSSVDQGELIPSEPKGFTADYLARYFSDFNFTTVTKFATWENHSYETNNLRQSTSDDQPNLIETDLVTQFIEFNQPTYDYINVLKEETDKARIDYDTLVPVNNPEFDYDKIVTQDDSSHRPTYDYSKIATQNDTSHQPTLIYDNGYKLQFGTVDFLNGLPPQRDHVNLGPELVTNGTFDSNTDWNYNPAHISIASGKCTFNGTVTDTLLRQLNVLEIGKTYVVTFDVSDRTAGTLLFRNPADTTELFTQNNGSYSHVFTALETQLTFRAEQSFAGSIDNISVKEVRHQDYTYVFKNLNLPSDTASSRVLLSNPDEFFSLFYILSTTDKYAIRDSSNTIHEFNKTMDYGVDLEVTLTKEDNLFSLYIDGVFQDSITINTTVSAFTALGRDSVSINGTLEGLEIYKQVVSDPANIPETPVYVLTNDPATMRTDTNGPAPLAGEDIQGWRDPNSNKSVRFGDGDILAGLPPQNKTERFGPELISNGDFADNSAWGVQANWSITGNEAVSSGITGASQRDLTQSGVLDSTKKYELTFDVTSHTSGNLRMYFTGDASTIPLASSVGPKKVTIEGKSTSVLVFTVDINNPFVGSIDNISIKEVIGIGSELVTNGDFSNGSTNWGLTGGTSIIANQANILSVTGEYAGITQSNILEVGKQYTVTYDVIATDGQDLKNNLGGHTFPAATTGSKSSIYTADEVNFVMKRPTPGSPANITVDNVSVKEITSSQDWTYVLKGLTYNNTTLINRFLTNDNTSIGSFYFQQNQGGQWVLRADDATYSVLTAPIEKYDTIILRKADKVINLYGDGVLIGRIGIDSSVGSRTYTMTRLGTNVAGLNSALEEFEIYDVAVADVNNITETPVYTLTNDPATLRNSDFEQINTGEAVQGWRDPNAVTSTKFGPTTMFQGLIPQNEIGRYGPNLVTNGGFSTDSDWTLGAGWTVSAGSAVYSGNNGTSYIFQNNIILNTGSTYLVKIDVAHNEGTGTNPIEFGTTRIQNTHLQIGTHEILYTPITGSFNFRIYARDGERFEISNISIRELLDVGQEIFVDPPDVINGFTDNGDGSYTVSSATGSQDQLIMSDVTEDLFSYECTITIDSISAGEINFAIGGDGSPAYTSAGTYTSTLTRNGGGDNLNVYGSADFVGTVSNISVRPTTGIGANLVTNGDFSAGDTGWNTQTIWSIAGGVATSNGSSASNGARDLYQVDVFTIGKTYQVSFDIVSYTSGTLRLWDGNDVIVPTSLGRKTLIFKPTVTRLIFNGGTDAFIGSIDNISVRETKGLGTEIGTNSYFSDGGTSWTAQNGSFSDGECTLNVVSSSFSYIVKSLDFTIGQEYLVKARVKGSSSTSGFRVTDNQAGTGALRGNNTRTLLSTDYRDYEFRFIATAGSIVIGLERDDSWGSDFDITIDSLVVRAVTNYQDFTYVLKGLDVPDDGNRHILLRNSLAGTFIQISTDGRINVRVKRLSNNALGDLFSTYTHTAGLKTYSFVQLGNDLNLYVNGVFIETIVSDMNLYYDLGLNNIGNSINSLNGSLQSLEVYNQAVADVNNITETPVQVINQSSLRSNTGVARPGQALTGWADVASNLSMHFGIDDKMGNFAPQDGDFTYILRGVEIDTHPAGTRVILADKDSTAGCRLKNVNNDLVINDTSDTEIFVGRWGGKGDIALRNSSNTLRVFVDGVQVGADVSITSTSLNSFNRLGRAGAFSIEGRIQSFEVYDVAVADINNITETPVTRFSSNLSSTRISDSDLCVAGDFVESWADLTQPASMIFGVYSFMENLPPQNEPLLGSELLANAGFDAQGDWVAQGGTTQLVFANSELLSYTPVGATGAYQVITTEVGKKYRFTAKARETALNALIRVSDGSVPDSGYGDATVVGLEATLDFVAIGTSTTIYLRNSNAGTSVWTEASVKEITGYQDFTYVFKGLEALYGTRGLLSQGAQNLSVAGNSDIRVEDSSGSYVFGKWDGTRSDIVLTRSGVEYKLYINGSLLGTVNNVSESLEFTRLGRDFSSINGSLQSLEIYNVAVSDPANITETPVRVLTAQDQSLGLPGSKVSRWLMNEHKPAKNRAQFTSGQFLRGLPRYTGDFTYIITKLKIEKTGGNKMLLSESSGAVTSLFFIYEAVSKTFAVRSQNNLISNFSEEPIYGKEFDVALVKEGYDFRLYINAVLKDTITVATNREYVFDQLGRSVTSIDGTLENVIAFPKACSQKELNYYSYLRNDDGEIIYPPTLPN